MKKIDTAKLWLKQKIELGPGFASDLINEAKSLGIKEKTLERARKKLGYVTSKSNIGTKGFWWWCNPKLKVSKSEWLERNAEWANHNLSNLDDFFIEEFLDDVKSEEYVLVKTDGDGIKRTQPYKESVYEKMQQDSIYLYADTRLKKVNQKVNKYREELKSDAEESREHRKEYDKTYDHSFDGQSDSDIFVSKTKMPSIFFFNKKYDKELKNYNKKKGNYLSENEIEVLKIEYNKRVEAGEFAIPAIDYSDYRNVPDTGPHIATYERFSKI